MASANPTLNTREILISPELCIVKIKQGVLLFSELDVKHKIPAGTYSSLSKYALSIFTACYDNFGNVFLPDQLDPDKVTDHIISEKHPDIDRKLLFPLVCRKQQKAINDLYTRMKEDDGISFAVRSLEGLNGDSLQKKYIKMYTKRQKEKPKLIRCGKQVEA